MFLLEYSYDIVILGTRDGQSCGRHSLAGRKEGARKNSADQGMPVVGERAATGSADGSSWEFGC